MYGFCNVWVCVCIGFVMCGCVYMWVLLRVGVCMYGFCNLWVCFDNCVGVLITCVLVFAVLLYCFVYVYLFLFVTSVRTAATE